MNNPKDLQLHSLRIKKINFKDKNYTGHNKVIVSANKSINTNHYSLRYIYKKNNWIMDTIIANEQ